jgi:hypothetical protein
MRSMYDSAYPAQIPGQPEMVAGYVDGKYVWTQADWDRFPNAVKVRIAVFPWTNDGDVLDCEKYDATPEECPAWIRMRQAAGLAVPTIYCGASAVPAVKAACAGLTYSLWIADWTGTPHLPDGAAACQYAARGTYDLSLVADWWMAAVPESPMPQDYKDKFGADVTWQGVADNLEGIIHSLQDRLEQIRAILAA